MIYIYIYIHIYIYVYIIFICVARSHKSWHFGHRCFSCSSLGGSNMTTSQETVQRRSSPGPPSTSAIQKMLGCKMARIRPSKSPESPWYGDWCAVSFFETLEMK